MKNKIPETTQRRVAQCLINAMALGHARPEYCVTYYYQSDANHHVEINCYENTEAKKHDSFFRSHLNVLADDYTTAETINKALDSLAKKLLDLAKPTPYKINMKELSNEE